MEQKTLSVEKIENVTIIQVLERRIFLQVADKFKKELLSKVDKGINCLLIDLSKVSVMNSAGIGVLLQVRDKITKRSGRLLLSGLQPIMQEIFSRMKLDSFFEVCNNRGEALRKFDDDTG